MTTPTKKLVMGKRKDIHILTPGGIMCGYRYGGMKPHSGLVTGRDICQRCLRALCAIWEPIATPPYEPPPF